MSANGAGSTVIDIEKRRAARREAQLKAREEQRTIDLAAVDRLEEEFGESVAALEVSSFVPGLPTMIVVKSPGGTPFYNRYKDQVRRAGKNAQAIGAAQEMLGSSCIVYPEDDETRKRLFEQFPGASLSAGQRAVKFVELEEEEEKKG